MISQRPPTCSARYDILARPLRRGLSTGMPQPLSTDVESQHVGDARPRRSAREAPEWRTAVADGFRGDRFGVLGEFATNRGHRPVHAHGGDDVAIFGEVGDHPLNPMPEVAIVSRGDFSWKIVVRISSMMVWRSSSVRFSRSATSGERTRATVPCRSMPAANNLWMTWSCRSCAMRSRSATMVSWRACSRRRREHECYRGVGGEIAHQVEVAVVERWLVCAAGDRDHADDFDRGSRSGIKIARRCPTSVKAWIG